MGFLDSINKIINKEKRALSKAHKQMDKAEEMKNSGNVKGAREL